MTPTIIKLADQGEVLSTRERGRAAADQLQDLMGEAGAVLSFAGVEVATPSYLDEVLGRLRSLLVERPEAIAVVTGVNSDIA